MEAHDDDGVSWGGVLYGHMMPGLPLVASRLAAAQRRRARTVVTVTRAESAPAPNVAGSRRGE